MVRPVGPTCRVGPWREATLYQAKGPARHPAINTSYVTHWNLRESGDAASIQHRQNGDDAVVTPASSAIWNRGPIDVRDRSNVSLGTLIRNPATSPTSTAFFDGLIGSTIASSPGIPRDEALMLKHWLATEYGIAI